MKFIVTLLPCLLSILLLNGCGKKTYRLDQAWSTPSKVTNSKDGLVGSVNLYKWLKGIIVMEGQDDKSAKCFLMGANTNSWSEVSLTGVPSGYFCAFPTISQTYERVFFQQDYMENDQLSINILLGHLTVDGNISVRDAVEKKWITDKESLFGQTRPNVRLIEPGRRSRPSTGVGDINDLNFYIPYCLQGETYYGNGIAGDEGPFNNGVFHSTDSGTTWQIEKISAFEAWLPSLCKTKRFYYYIAANNYQRDLWFSSKPTEGDSWSTPKTVTKTFCNSALYWKYIAAAEDGAIHLCWLDRQHEKRRYNLDAPDRQNYEVAYCHRKDSDSDWSKNIILSKGLFYSYSPAMSIEGDKIVVAWSGIQAAEDWHNEDNPNDIYCATSKDGGNTWTKPLKVTDRAKDGITSGMPQVMLLNSVIHLFYTQGKRESQQLSPGLTKLNQPPWSIYYTQRPFPE